MRSFTLRCSLGNNMINNAVKAKLKEAVGSQVIIHPLVGIVFTVAPTYPSY